MKNTIALFFALITSTAFGAIEYDEVRTSNKDLVNVHNLKCQINLGGQRRGLNREMTVLTRFFFNPTNFPSLKFKHEALSMAGCDLPVLDQMIDDSHTSFGHLEATVTVIQGTAKKPRLLRGQCVVNIREQVVIDFGQGVVLESSLKGTVIPASGCH